MEYDLAKRTTNFSKEILFFCKDIRIKLLTKNIIEQLIRSSTSIGANYFEATGSSSRKDFRNKIYLCKKEAQETEYWLTLLSEIEAGSANEIVKLVKEAHELVLIFGKIAASSN